MATVLDRSAQTLTDVTGLIYDRSVTPEKLIGQGWIISKSRIVTLASLVANYSEAPWALIIRFPYPDLTFAAKTISFHPEFNKRAVRDHYLSQANELVQQPIILDHDIATITLDADIADLQPDKVQELNRALSLPLQISPQDLSGVMRAGETGNILQKAIVSGRSGVLNFYDDRKVPFARLLIRGGQIQKASFQHLQNEFAVCELMWRKPGGNFVLQSQDNVSWVGIEDIRMSTDQLANEANRRTQDLPRMLDALGGPNARYSKAKPNIDLNQINPQIRWIVERLWPTLDGSLPLSKYSERLQVDTYTALQALWEMKHLGLVASATADLFHKSGQMGQPLTVGHDLDLKIWDGLQAFHLDDLSGIPVMMQGNYFGSTNLLTSNTLLHTIPVVSKYGAAILKDGRIIGVHNNKYVPAKAAATPPFPLLQMTWIGCLTDMSAKRMRASTSSIELESDAESDSASAGRSTQAGMRRQGSMAGEGPQVDQPDLQRPVTSSEPEILQKFSKIQILGAGGAMFLIGLLMSLGSMLAPKPTVVATSQPNQTSTAASTSTTSGNTNNSSTSSATTAPAPSANAPDSMKAALAVAGFKETTIPTFEFFETSKDTAPKPSFGIQSEASNLKILFVQWPNAIVKNVVDSNTNQTPFWPAKIELGMGVKQIEEGETPHNMYFRANHYFVDRTDEKTKKVEAKRTVGLVGAFPSTQPDSSILVIAFPFKGEGDLDYRSAMTVVERMFADKSASDSSVTPEQEQAASPADVDAYRQKIGDIIKANYKAPADADRANKCTVRFIVDASGQISKLELKYASGIEEVDKGLQKAVTAKLPFPAPPKTKDGTVAMQVTVDGGGEFSAGEW